MVILGGSTYIITNKNLTTLYTGSTVDIHSRYCQHVDRYYPNSFSARYILNRLVFLKHFSTIEEARQLEYYIKGKRRQWKLNLIEKGNPLWRNLREIIDNDEIDTYFDCYSEADFGFR